MTVATAALGGPAMGELLSAGRLGAERHRLDAVRQDAHAPRLDLERHALVLVGVLPFVAHGAALDQHPHTFLVQRLPALGVAVPQLHGRPDAAASCVRMGRAACSKGGCLYVEIKRSAEPLKKK